MKICSKGDGEVMKQGQQKRITPVVAVLQRKLSHVCHSNVFYTTQKGGKVNIFTMTTVYLAAVIGLGRVQETCRFLWQIMTVKTSLKYRVKAVQLSSEKPYTEYIRMVAVCYVIKVAITEGRSHCSNNVLDMN